ncbi:MAG: hypothetical protein OEV44_04240 [Spirochaetota bacterium]|nr:hypothetical protein [Spirochaetota bacterium]
MFGFGTYTLLLIASGISAVLFFVLALYKRYAYYWWAVGGIVICFPIALVSNSISKTIDKKLKVEILFIIIYFVIYTALWIFSKRSAITEEERRKREKMDEAVFDGFMALKEKKINEAYHIFKNAYLIDPDNPIVKTILASFHQGQHGLIKKNRLSEWRFKLFILLKGKRKYKNAYKSSTHTDNINTKK